MKDVFARQLGAFAWFKELLEEIPVTIPTEPLYRQMHQHQASLKISKNTQIWFK